MPCPSWKSPDEVYDVNLELDKWREEAPLCIMKVDVAEADLLCLLCLQTQELCAWVCAMGHHLGPAPSIWALPESILLSKTQIGAEQEWHEDLLEQCRKSRLTLEMSPLAYRSVVFSNYLSAIRCSTCRYSGKLNISECQADMEVRKGVFLNKASVRGGIRNQVLMAALDLTN